MANTNNNFVGAFGILSEFESSESPVRMYSGLGDPNELLLSDNQFFIPLPRPNDKFSQIDATPVLEWVFTITGTWKGISTMYDIAPPRDTMGAQWSHVI